MSISASFRRGCNAFVAAAITLFAAANAAATNPVDLGDCEDIDDLPRMIAACTKLAQDGGLPLDVRSMASFQRGFGNFALGNIDAAQADFSEAIRLNPRNNYAHHELGLTLTRKGDLTGALASLTEAIRLDPTSAASRFGRGQIYLSQNRLGAAIDDFTNAIKLGADKKTVFAKGETIDRPQVNRVTADYYAARGDAYYLGGNFRDAELDYDQAARFSDAEGANLIWRAVARTRQEPTGTDPALSAAIDNGQLKDWPRSLGELLVGRITPAAALARAKDSDQICEAHYYSGIVQIKVKEAAAAEKEFVAARDQCPPLFREYRAAVADLKRLQSH